jgi:arginine decarboxylase
LQAYQKRESNPSNSASEWLLKKNLIFLSIPPGLGIRAKDILEFYVDEIEGYEDKFQLKMLHIFLNKGIKDDIYYWSELNKIINLYCQLKKICPELDSINIGGGFPIKHSLGFEYDYQFMINEIVSNIKESLQESKSAHAEYLY